MGKYVMSLQTSLATWYPWLFYKVCSRIIFQIFTYIITTWIIGYIYVKCHFLKRGWSLVGPNLHFYRVHIFCPINTQYALLTSYFPCSLTCQFFGSWLGFCDGKWILWYNILWWSKTSLIVVFVCLRHSLHNF
jgi:hypothetical protein